MKRCYQEQNCGGAGVRGDASWQITAWHQTGPGFPSVLYACSLHLVSAIRQQIGHTGSPTVEVVAVLQEAKDE